MKGIRHDRLNKSWSVSDRWVAFFGFSGLILVIICLDSFIGIFR